jgi:hypothetical protein
VRPASPTVQLDTRSIGSSDRAICTAPPLGSGANAHAEVGAVDVEAHQLRGSVAGGDGADASRHVDGVGHLLHVEHSEPVAQGMAEFLQRNAIARDQVPVSL